QTENTVGDQLPPGARNSVGCLAPPRVMASLVRSISAVIWASVMWDRLGWVQVWLATRWPAALTSATSEACLSALWPIMQNVAAILYCASSASTCGVYLELGPSSMVRAIDD